MKQVITLQNGSKLNEQQFIKYFEKKVFYTIRKFRLFEDIKQRPKVQELFLLTKLGKITIFHECLDDISVLVLKAMMKTNGKKELKKLLPHVSKIIRPFYLMSKEEMILYSKLKKIRYKLNNDFQVCSSGFHLQQSPKTSINNIQDAELSSFLNELEKQQRNVKNSIVNSLLKLENLI